MAPLSKADTFTFSGHETFILRSNWLKKAYDLLQAHPDLFAFEDAFVRLGVGKNMANSIRFWGRVCGIFARGNGAEHRATWLGRAIFDDADGWDPFLVTPTSRWLLHWQIAARPDVAFTWYFTFNRLRRSEFSSAQLAQAIAQAVAQQGAKPPSAATLDRDIDCMVRCYIRPEAALSGANAEEALHCPLHELDLIQQFPGQSTYRLISGAQATLPDELVAFAALWQARALGRATIAFNELAYGERSPGRVFRLSEDELLTRLLRIEQITQGQAVYADTGGIRQVAWRAVTDEALERMLLETAYARERRYA